MPSLLSLRQVRSGYGRKDVLKGVSVDLSGGTILAILGHNGAGKSTLLRTIFGLVPLRAGTVTVDGEPLKPTPEAMLRRGVAYIPQASTLFPQLSVHDCIRLAISSRNRLGITCLAIDEITARFPSLAERLGQSCRSLSGGERQMLSLAMGLASVPKIALIDEPSLGLAPRAARDMLQTIRDLATEFDTGVLLVEQRVGEAVRMAHKAIVISRGVLSYEGDAAPLAEDRDKLFELFVS